MEAICWLADWLAWLTWTRDRLAVRLREEDEVDLPPLLLLCQSRISLPNLQLRLHLLVNAIHWSYVDLLAEHIGAEMRVELVSAIESVAASGAGMLWESMLAV